MATIKDLKRMCDTYENCIECPMGDTCCAGSIASLPDNSDEIVDDWVAEHPIKTYSMDFFEKFPNARTYKGIPTICLRDIHPELGDKCYRKDCLECWNMEIQEQ